MKMRNLINIIEGLESVDDGDNLNEEQRILIKYIREQIAHPTRAVVNSESAFVAGKLRNNGYSDLASRYWSWVCSNYHEKDMFGHEVYKLQMELDKLKVNVPMDGWLGS